MRQTVSRSLLSTVHSTTFYILFLLLLCATIFTTYVQAAPGYRVLLSNEVGPYTVVSLPAETLLTRIECERPEVFLENGKRKVRVPVDANGDLYHPYITSKDKNREGTVGLSTYKLIFCPLTYTVNGETTGLLEYLVKNGFVKPTDVAVSGTVGTGLGPSDLEKSAITLLNWFIWIFAATGVWVLKIAAYFLGVLLSASSFITNPIVVKGWPFIQGIANLGFIIALLFIAAATTLRLEIGGGLKRLLPRLLLAALLINFSLVIGAVIIDASRLFMAVIANLMGIDRIDNIGGSILESSLLITSVFDLTTVAGANSSALGTVGLRSGLNTSWSIPFQVLQATILIWGLVVGITFVAIGLLIRHIALLLLLIVSPIAYLAFAFPGMQQQAHKWWSNFLKYVIYGPVAMFILLLLVVVTNAANQTDFFGNDKKFTVMSLLTSTITTIAVCVIAAVAAKSMGAAGSAAAMSFALGQGKNALRGRGLVGTPLRYGAKGAYVGTGARALTRQARDAGGAVKSGIRNKLKDSRLTRWMVPAKRDDKGKLKAGESSWGASLGGRIAPKTAAAKAARAAATTPATITAAAGPGGALSPEALLKSDVIENLRGDEVNRIGQHGLATQVNVLVTSKQAVRKMDAATKAQILSGVSAGGATAARKLERTIRTIISDDDRK